MPAITPEQWLAIQKGKRRISADSLKKKAAAAVKKRKPSTDPKYRTIKEDLENMTEFEQGLERKARERKLMKTMSETEIKIDKGIPVPIGATHKGNFSKYPLSKMVIGDSFYTEDATFVRVTAHMYAKKLAIKIMVRRWENGWRVWRVK